MRLTEWTMEEQEQLIHFMTTNNWPFHGNSNPAREIIEKTIEEGGYESDEVKTFWVENEDQVKVGFVKVFDLQDEIPVFDLRIAENHRGHGYGPAALRKVADYVFSLPEEKIRVEGHTRQDNFAMRKTFERVGFVKEGHLRKAWFSPKEKSYYDAITYGMTREDYLQGTTTPVHWDDSQAAVETDTQVHPAMRIFPDAFESERLLIRAPKLEDAEHILESIKMSHKALKAWMPWAQKIQTLEETTENVRLAMADFITRKDLRLHLFLKETGEFIGCSGYHRINWKIPKVEIGYWLDSRFEGKGYMTEAAERLTEFAFEDLGARRVEIRCDIDNVRSRAVAERLKFSLEGILIKEGLSADGKLVRDTCIYAKTK